MKKNRNMLKRLRSALPRKKSERTELEHLVGFTVTALVISIFLASSLDKYLIATNQYAAVIAAVLVDLANGDRSGQSLDTLTINPVLVAAAQAKADDMAKNGYFAHVSPTGVDPWYWFKQVGYNFSYAGENLAVDFSDSGDVNDAWMNSPTHRENILNPHFTEIGIATAEGEYQGHHTIFVVQEFGAPAASQRPIVSQTVPESPTATAEAKSTAPAAAPAPEPKSAAVAGAQTQNTATLPAKPAANTNTLAEKAPAYASWWEFALASPRTAMWYAYLALGALVLILLAFATGFELRWHHRRKATYAGITLALMCTLFVLGDLYIFGEPSVASGPAMTAAAASAL